MVHSMDMESKVCVTGAAGYLGSSLVKMLLEKGCIVHATTRNLGDDYKVALRKGLPNAATRLRLYEADIYNPSELQPAIEAVSLWFIWPPHYSINPRILRFVEKLERDRVWVSNKLKETGFEYKCDVKTVLQDSINCGLKLRELNSPSSQV